MKRVLSVVLCVLAVVCLAACGGGGETTPPDDTSQNPDDPPGDTPDDSDAAPHDMVLNKAKRNKGIAAPFCTRAAALPLLFSAAWRAVRPPRQRAGAHRPAAGNRFR